MLPQKQPIIIAHRGSSAFAPENTLAAFELAIEQNSDAIELDAKFTQDGEIVVIHDNTLDRTTNGTGKILDLPLNALKELDAGSWFNPKFQGETIPTLREVLESVGNKIFINIELTNYSSPLDRLPEKSADLIKQFGLENNVLISSFNPLALIRVHKLIPNIQLGLLALPGFWGAWARSWMGKIVTHHALHPEIGDTSRELIHNQHQKGNRVNVWTVNSISDMRKLIQWNVDGIITDNPPLASKIRKE